MPPRPMAAASAAAASRRVRSLRNGARSSNRAFTLGSMAIPYSILPNPGFATLILSRYPLETVREVSPAESPLDRQGHPSHRRSLGFPFEDRAFLMVGRGTPCPSE